ncbi:MAG: zinc ribbon domain-containing protein [Chloroflexota bacterium]|mgnify:CR=1 FL=1|nr:MAG: hypothetical protein DIU68_12695 [Chloroflexota bacterium]
MPVYDYRCNQCGRRVALFYKTYKDYDEATHTCPNCGSTDLTRLISRVAIARPSRNYENMSSDEMLSVLEGGNPREVGEMMRQLGQDEEGLGDTYKEVTERLLKGESPEKIEQELGPALEADAGGDMGGIGDDL